MCVLYPRNVLTVIRLPRTWGLAGAQTRSKTNIYTPNGLHVQYIDRDSFTENIVYVWRSGLVEGTRET